VRPQWTQFICLFPVAPSEDSTVSILRTTPISHQASGMWVNLVPLASAFRVLSVLVMLVMFAVAKQKFRSGNDGLREKASRSFFPPTSPSSPQQTCALLRSHVGVPSSSLAPSSLRVPGPYSERTCGLADVDTSVGGLEG
jgi:hypothetical protein